MKVTAKSRYALRILLDVAMGGGASGRPRTIRQIAASQAISEKFISRIVVPLRRAGMLKTVRGVQGGLRLAREPEAVTLLDVVQTMEGPIRLLPCLARPRSCKRSGRCAAESVWSEVNDGVAEALRRLSLADVLERQLAFGPPPGGEPEYMI